MSDVPQHCHEQIQKCTDNWGSAHARLDALEKRFDEHATALMDIARVLRSLERCQGSISSSMPRVVNAVVENNKRQADLEATVNQMLGEAKWASRISWYIATLSVSSIASFVTWYLTSR